MTVGDTKRESSSIVSKPPVTGVAPPVDGFLQVRPDLLASCTVVERTHSRLRIHRISRFVCLGSLSKSVANRLGYRRLDEHLFTGATDLPGVVETGKRSRFDCSVEVGVVHNYDRPVPAQFKDCRFESSIFADSSTGLWTAGESQRLHVLVAHDLVADHWSLTGNDVDNAIRNNVTDAIRKG